MKKTMKKAVAFILALTLSLSGIVTPAYAESADPDKTKQESGSFMTNNIDNMKFTGNGSMAKLLANELTENNLVNSECNITEIIISEKSAAVKFQTTTEADLVVAIYDEETEQMLASGAVVVTAGQSETVVDLEGEIPSAFIARGYLLETDEHIPLCDPFTTEQYTHDLQELKSMTIDSFEEELVLNLDENRETNFAVFNVETIRVPASDEINILVNNGDGTYTVQNPDKRFTSLKAGDTFSYEYSDGTVELILITEIAVVDNKVEILADADAGLTDFFDYVKIEADSYDCEPIYDDSELEDGVEILPEEQNPAMILGIDIPSTEFSHSIKVGIKKEFEDKEASFKGSIEGNVEIKFTVTFSLYLSLTHVNTSLKTSLSVGLKTQLKGKMEFFEIPLPKIQIPILPIVNVEFTPKFVGSFSASIVLDGKLTFTAGFSLDSIEGFQNLSESPVAEIEHKVEGSISVGIKMEAGVNVISEKICGMKIKGTVEIKVKVSKEDELYNSKEDVRHDCTECYSGEVSAEASLTVEAKIAAIINNVSYDIFKITVKLFDFYYSKDYDDFGYGSCPHKQYKVTILVKDEEGNPVEGALIEVPGLEQHLETDIEGNVSFYLLNGEYAIKAAKGLESGSETIVLPGDTQQFTIVIKPVYRDVTVTIVNLQGEPIRGAFLRVTNSKGDTSEYYADEKGKVFLSLENDEFELEAIYERYYGTDKIVVTENMDYTMTLLALRYEVAIVVMNELGMPVSDATVTIQGVTDSVLTDENGEAIIYLFQGEYTLTASKDADFGTGKITVVDRDIQLNIYFSDSILASGHFGAEKDNLEWILYKSGKLVVSGIGSMGNITGIRPWSKWIKNITSIEIYDGVTDVGHGAFTDCTALTDVSLPDSIISIGYGAFESCSSLKRVIIPMNVATLWDFSFSSSGLEEIYFMGNQPKFRAECFYNITANAYYPSGNDTWSSGIDVPPVIGGSAYLGGNITWIPWDLGSGLSYDYDEQEGNTEELNQEVDVKEEQQPNDVIIAFRLGHALNSYTGTVTDGTKQIAEFNNLVPGEPYVLVVVKSLDRHDLFAPENLLYIAQQRADEGGFSAFTYIPRTEDHAEVRAYGIGRTEKPNNNPTPNVPSVSEEGSITSPATGDNSLIACFLISMIFSGIAVCAVLFNYKRNRYRY